MLVPGVWFVNRHRFLPSVVIAYIPLRLGEYCPASTIFAGALPQQNRYPTQVVASNKMLPKIGEAIAWEEASARWQNRNCWRRSETATELHRSGRKAGFSASSSR